MVAYLQTEKEKMTCKSI